MSIKKFQCSCGGHYLRVEKNYDFPFEAYFSNFQPDDSVKGLSILNRTKLAIRYIFNPKKFDLYEHIILDSKELFKLIKFLKEN